MFTTDQILTFLITASVSISSTWYVFHLNKKKYKAETEKIVVDMLVLALSELRKERDEEKRVIDEMKKKMIEQQTRAEDCEFEHQITKLQLQKCFNKLELTRWVKSSVFVLDTSRKVIEIFTYRFKTVPILYFKGFTDPKLCLEAAKKEKPEILVLDYHLSDDGRTAEEIIKSLGYEPAIFVMGTNKEYNQRFFGTEIKYFYKDEFYVRNITKAILQYLIEKNAD